MALLEAHGIYALAWLSFGLGHSLLAEAKAKNLLASTLGPYYRLSYNFFASLHILAVWLVGDYVLVNQPAFTFSPAVKSTLGGVSVLGIIILVMALRSYDLGRLAGTSQIRNHLSGLDEPEDEPLCLTGFHAYVRHPIYSGAYLILWGGAQDQFGLATAIWGSAYLIIGTLFEEKRLQRLYGDEYENYQNKVPVFFPWRGKAI